MYYTIKTHYYNLDDTLGDTLDLYTRLNKEVRLYDSGNNEDLEPHSEDTQEFYFHSLEALETFLYYLLAQAARVLSHSTGDDSYYDYTPSFMNQYREFLLACQEIDLTQDNILDYMKDNEYTRKTSFPRALQLNIEFFNNAVINHQEDWFDGDILPITIPTAD